MKTEVVLGIVARTAHHLVDAITTPGGHSDARANRASIRARSNQFDDQRPVLAVAIMAQQRRRRIEIVNHHFNLAVVVEIAESAAARNALRRNSGPRPAGDVFKTTVATIAIQQAGLLIGEVQLAPG